MRKTRVIPERDKKPKIHWFVMTKDGSLKHVAHDKIDYDRPLIKQLLNNNQ